MRVLFATPEAHPLIKTGGLADVAGSLPRALAARGIDVRLVLPGYPKALANTENLEKIGSFRPGWIFGDATLWQGTLPGSDIPVYLIGSGEFFDRIGHPYLGADGYDWPDNHRRFNLFNRAVVDLAMDDLKLGWKPDVVHCHDWQTGLIPVLLHTQPERPKTVFTIHNMAYQGLFPKSALADLHLSWRLFTHNSMEFWDQLSFMKGGLNFADHITTVSPTYAQEIKTAEYAYGLEGLLNHRANALSGILNGIDHDVWNPGTDPALDSPYSVEDLSGKKANKQALQQMMGLPVEDRPLLAHIGRLVSQKGVDLILDTLPGLLERGAQVAILGSGDSVLEARLSYLAKAHPDQVGIQIGYNESLAHLIEAGADIFLMPSRFEPCGLNQMYSLRYGTPPIVRATGGLADTVTDASPEAIAEGTATGFVFQNPIALELGYAINRALDLYEDQSTWQGIITNAMKKDFSWDHSAGEYEEMYVDVTG
ncbi:MAG: glycogen synthase GlgA [Gammaproteobacteria bacterium]